MKNYFTLVALALLNHNATLELDGIKGAIGRRSVCFDELNYNADGTMQYVEQTK